MWSCQILLRFLAARDSPFVPHSVDLREPLLSVDDVEWRRVVPLRRPLKTTSLGALKTMLTIESDKFESTPELSGATGRHLANEFRQWEDSQKVAQQRAHEDTCSRKNGNSSCGDQRKEEDSESPKVTKEIGFWDVVNYSCSTPTPSTVTPSSGSELSDAERESFISCILNALTQCGYAPVWRKIIANPILMAFILGFLLNATRVPEPKVVGSVLSSFGTAFSPLLFFLLGMTLDFTALFYDAKLRHLVVKGLILRTFVTGVAAALCWIGMDAMGVDEGPRFVTAICLIAPVANVSFFFLSEFGYDKEAAALLNTSSNITSFILIFVFMKLMGTR